METTRAIQRIDREMGEIDVAFPIWLFLPEDQTRPRKLADPLPPGARPAKIRGWCRWYWRFGVDMERWWGSRSQGKSSYNMPPAKLVLDVMRYDADYDHADYRVIFEPPKGSDATESIDLREWYEDVEGKHQQRAIQRIERSYDELTIWDLANKVDISSDAEVDTKYVVEGLAIPVSSSEELHSRIITKRHPEAYWNYYDGWRQLDRAQFEFTDEEGGVSKGIIFNGRAQQFEGIIAGSSFQYNNQFLVGTKYESLSKEEKMAYFDSVGIIR